MSALPLKADVDRQHREVRFVPKGDIHPLVETWTASPIQPSCGLPIIDANGIAKNWSPKSSTTLT